MLCGDRVWDVIPKGKKLIFRKFIGVVLNKYVRNSKENSTWEGCGEDSEGTVLIDQGEPQLRSLAST